MNFRCVVVALLAAAGTSLAFAQGTLDHPVGQLASFSLDTGFLSNNDDQPRTVASFPVHIDRAAWLRLYFEDAQLAAGSAVRLTSLLDGQVQLLDSKGLTQWSSSSAYFNGDTVMVELIAGPHSAGNRLFLKRVGMEPAVHPLGEPGICGICGVDDRQPSGELWSGRLLPVGCSASVYCAVGTGMITAGHCLAGQTTLVVEFNVPPSNGDCSLSHPPVADQFPVQPGFQYLNAGVGADWGVYVTGPNSLGQSPVQRYNQFRPLASARAALGTTAAMNGYGLDTNCVRSQTQQLSLGSITFVGGDHYQFNADVRGGNSGSGLLNAAGELIGVVTHCSTNCPNYGTDIFLPSFDAGRATVNPGNCAGLPPPPPVNDNCAGATLLSVGTTSGSTVSSTADGTVNCGTANGPDVWYAFTPGCNGSFTFDTCAAATFDTQLSLHSGCPGTASNILACNDDFCAGTRSSISADLVAGTRYLLRVGGWGGSSGTFTLTVTQNTFNPPPNDQCASAMPITPGAYSADTSCATNDGVNSCFASTAKDVWFSVTPTCDGTYTADTCAAATFDTMLSVHTGCPGNAANQIACNDDYCNLRSSVTWAATANTTYLIRVAAFSGTDSGPFTLTLSGGGQQTNDACANAIAVGPGSYPGSTQCATPDGDAACGYSVTSNDVWYEFDSPVATTVTADLLGSTYDTVLSVHTGCPGNAANDIACDDDSAGGFLSRVSFSAQANTDYYIRVSGFGGASGSYVLNIATGEGLPNDACADATPITDGTTPFSNVGATTDGSPAGICMAFGTDQIGQDIWYTYTASCDGDVTVDTCGSDFDTKIAAYDSVTCPTGEPIACNDDLLSDTCLRQSSITFPAVNGQQFLLRIGGYSTSTGSGVINIACTPSGSTCSACPADFNQDGGVDGGDVASFFLEWEASGPCADVNLDGGIDGGDVATFFSSWEAGGC